MSTFSKRIWVFIIPVVIYFLIMDKPRNLNFSTSSVSEINDLKVLQSIDMDRASEFEQGSDNIVLSLDQIMKEPISLQQDDARLIKRIREKYLVAPSNSDYNLTYPEKEDPSMGEPKYIRYILGDQVENPFFVECGGLDGESHSNTLVLEKRYGWKGVLIEADPKNFELLLQKNRKSYAVPACLSTKPYPNTVIFAQKYNTGKITNLKEVQEGYVEVQCLPFYSILLALNRTSVDFFSLDVEGAELDILNTIPWDKVHIKTLSIEHLHVAGGRDALQKFMEGKGYTKYIKRGAAYDLIFHRNDIIPKKLTY